MAPKATPKAAAAPPPPPVPVVEGTPLDEYSEGEEEDIPKSKIKVEIISATAVWGIESTEEKSRIAFDIRFPEEPPPPPSDPSSPPIELQSFLPEIEPIPKGVWPLPPPPPPPLPPDPASPSPSPAPKPANFKFSFVREFERTPSYHLCNQLVQEPMVITVHWISPSGASKSPIATAQVDLTELLHLHQCTLTTVSPLTPYVETVVAAPPAAPAAKGAGAPRPAKKGAAGVAAAPAQPPPELLSKPQLLEGASITTLMSTSGPLVTDADRQSGFVIEVEAVTIRELPKKVQELGTRSVAERQSQPFAYSVGFTMPGFSADSAWWNAVNDMGDSAAKKAFGEVRLAMGAVAQEEVTVPKVQEMEVDGRAGARELKQLLFGGEGVKLDCSIEELEDEWRYPLMVKEMRNVVVWNACKVKRYLPGQAANEVRENIKRKKHIQGVVAQYVSEESFNNITDPFFQRYRSTFDLDMTPFFDHEGTLFLSIPCPLGEFIEATDSSFCLPDARSPSKTAKIVEDDSGPLSIPPLATKGAPPPPFSLPLPNAWKEAKSIIYLTIKTSAPIEPIWTPPPEPELKVENLIPPRPKCPNLHDSVKVATQKFKEFVQVAAHDISFLHQKVLQGEETTPLGTDSTPDTKSRIQSKQDVRRKVVLELHQSGAWKQMRDEMKSRVLRIAAEQFRLGTKDAIIFGKFEFCNALYVKLMEEVHTCLAEMFLKRQRIANALEGHVCIELSEKEKKLIFLRQLANEYEYNCDFETANKYHQDRLLGESIHNSDIWFEYGCFNMRTKENGLPKDRGKAEECFREALTLDNKHYLSLIALACLKWHRNYCTQSEALLRTAIDLHTEEEWLPWCILSQHLRYQGSHDVYPYVHLDVGHCHLHLHHYAAAKAVFLRLCQSHPTSSSWLGAGVALFRACEYRHCEIALVEANHMDSRNGRVWAYLAMACLAMDRNEEAEVAFQQVQKAELRDVALLLEVADGFAKCGNYRDAEAAATEALKEEAGQVVARLKLGTLHRQQGKLEFAKREYKSVMDLEAATCTEKNLAEECYNQVQADVTLASTRVSDRRVTM